MWDAGVSTAAIGRLLGCGKNAVVGKARRLDLPSRPSPIRESAPGAPPSLRQIRVQRKQSSSVRLPPLAVLSVPEPEVIMAPIQKKPPAPPAREQTAFASHQFPPKRKCLFPFGELGTKGFRFCGEYVVTPGPYCDQCRRIAYSPKRENSGERDAA
jgi:GcrA cell cycle regulator